MALATLLYVEDEENDVFFMRLAVRQAWADLVLRDVANGQEAIAYLSGQGAYADRTMHPLPGIVLLDLNLPVLSGFDVLEWIRRHPRFDRVPVVIFSSSGREEDQARARSLHADDYLIKPASGAEFGGIVGHLKELWLSSALPSPKSTL
jgi:CheY-like chemotaxis protein